MWPFEHVNYLVVMNLLSRMTFFIPLTSITIFEQPNELQYTFPSYQIDIANALAVDKYPEQFHFGVSTSAYQTEGAWNVDGKGESVWDYMTHENTNFIVDRSNADVAADSYHNYQTDIKLAKKLGSKMYKISLSWPRILPNGLQSHVNKKGIEHYDRVIDEIIANGMTPIVTLFHWDLPESLEQIGGLTNPLIIDFFRQYAMIAFDAFGDRVKYWVTINEPSLLCLQGYGGDVMIPAMNLSGRADYICGHNLLLAHAEIYAIYQQKYRPIQNGNVGIVLDLKWFEPENPKSVEDRLAAERAFQWWNGWFLHPLFSEDGDYPFLMRTTMVQNASKEYLYSRLPVFEYTEVQRVQNSADFLGISFRSANLIRNAQAKPDEVSSSNDARILVVPDMWPGQFPTKLTPWALGKLLNRMDLNYQLPPIIVTEIGYMDDGEMQDKDRSVYHREHLWTLLEAMKNGIDVRGYLVRSFIDSFEWTMGYTLKSGIFSVDFNDENRTRTPRLSSKIIEDVYKNRRVRTVKEIIGKKYSFI